MRTQHPFRSRFPRRIARTALGLLAVLSLITHTSQAAAPTVATQLPAYYPGEDIFVRFAGGPGNLKDWIALLPAGADPGTATPSSWLYADGTTSGTNGVLEGSVRFPGGLGTVGDWSVYLLENDGVEVLAMSTFQIIDPTTVSVRTNQRRYAPGDSIVVLFNNGPGNPKDWIAVFKAGASPETDPFELWAYVDGTTDGVQWVSSGSVSFPRGLTEPGDYDVHLLVDNGFDIFASATFTVAAPDSESLRLLKWRPVNGATGLPPELVFSATLASGPSPVDPASVVLTLDGAPVAAQVFGDNRTVSVDYTSPQLPAPNSSHTWVLTAPDTAAPPNVLRVETTATIGYYRNIVLPPPVYLENFELATQGEVPEGWTQKSYTTPANDTENFQDLGSATYGRWGVVEVKYFEDTFITYGNPDNPIEWGQDYRRVLSVNPFNVLNGQIYGQPMAVGRFLFGNSGYANADASQVLYLFSPDINLSAVANPHLIFNSVWEQNQDSIASIEYSIDRGTTWLPLAYFLDGPDIVTTTDPSSGATIVDAVATFQQEHADVARYVDDNGVEVGGHYGAFIGAPVSQALAPYIQARVDDDPVESKRIEIFHLPAAANQPAVRFRFAHAGTDSWYFGIDDFGLYSMPIDPTTPPTLSVSRDASGIRVTWTGTLQSADRVTGPWSAQTGVTSPASFPATAQQRFFRAAR